MFGKLNAEGNHELQDNCRQCIHRPCKLPPVTSNDRSCYLLCSAPEGPTPTVSSTHSSPALEKKPIDALPVMICVLDSPDDEEDFVPGYASIDQNAEHQQQSTLSRQPSNAESHLSIQRDDGIPDYATVNERTKKKYRSRGSLVKLNLTLMDKDIKVMDYAELDMPPGGPVPVVQPEDTVDYAEIDFTRTL